ncbi:hypothetical protein GCM10025787_35410 [Saccharopolyspora rosea]
MTASSTELTVAWVLSCADKHDHAITDEENAWFFQGRSDLPEALCGHRVVTGSLTLPPGPRCAHCEAIFRARSTLFDPDLRMARRPRPRRQAVTFLRRLLHRPVRSASRRSVSRARRSEADHGDRAADSPTVGAVAVPHPVPDPADAASAPATRTE